MKKLLILVLAVFGGLTGVAQADSNHDKWIIIQSMSSPIFRASIAKADRQIARLGRIDTSTRQGRRAKQLVRQAKILQAKIRRMKKSRMSPAAQRRAMNNLRQLGIAMHNNKPGKGTQGACFKSCDDAYGSGFGKGKGWNRFWCKASCFKINVNVGKGKGTSRPKGMTALRR
jgi:hypothetical protein